MHDSLPNNCGTSLKYCVCVCVCVCVSSVAPYRPQSTNDAREYAFEMASSNLRYGSGVTREVGLDVLNLGIKNLVVVTDKNVRVPVVMKYRCSLYK